jgi:hypothetical protein
MTVIWYDSQPMLLIAGETVHEKQVSLPLSILTPAAAPAIRK